MLWPVEYAEYRGARASHPGDFHTSSCQRAHRTPNFRMMRRDDSLQIVCGEQFDEIPVELRRQWLRCVGRGGYAAVDGGIPTKSIGAGNGESWKYQNEIPGRQWGEWNQLFSASESDRCHVFGCKKCHVRAQASRDRRKGRGVERRRCEGIEGPEYRSGVCAATTQPAPDGNSFFDFNRESPRPERHFRKGDGGAPSKILFRGPAVRAGGFERAAGGGSHDNRVRKRDPLKERFELVKAAGCAAENAEKKIELRLRFDARRAAAHAGVGWSPLFKSRKCRCMRERYIAPMTVMGMYDKT